MKVTVFTTYQRFAFSKKLADLKFGVSAGQNIAVSNNEKSRSKQYLSKFYTRTYLKLGTCYRAEVITVTLE